jgi:hypothetical protein
VFFFVSKKSNAKFYQGPKMDRRTHIGEKMSAPDNEKSWGVSPMLDFYLNDLALEDIDRIVDDECKRPSRGTERSFFVDSDRFSEAQKAFALVCWTVLSTRQDFPEDADSWEEQDDVCRDIEYHAQQRRQLATGDPSEVDLMEISSSLYDVGLLDKFETALQSIARGLLLSLDATTAHKRHTLIRTHASHKTVQDIIAKIRQRVSGGQLITDEDIEDEHKEKEGYKDDVTQTDAAEPKRRGLARGRSISW